MKRFIKYFLIIIFVLTTGAIFYISMFDVPLTTKSKKNHNVAEYVYKTSGAVKYNGSYYSSKKLTYRQLFFKQELLVEANIKEFRLDEIAPVNVDIYVPFKNAKLNWTKLSSEKELEIRGISKKYAKILVEYKRKNKELKLEWNDFLKIPGIGKKTVEKLRTFLVLD